MSADDSTAESHTRLESLGVQLPARPDPSALAATLSFESPCFVQGEVDWATEVCVGAFSVFYGGRLAQTRIGRYCSIAPGAVLGSAEHPMDRLTTSIVGFDPRYHNWHDVLDRADDVELWNVADFAGRPVTTIGNDVWFGADVFVKAGITIGDGAVIAARSVVTKNVPPYVVMAGTPARMLRPRFNEATVDRLLALFNLRSR
jgi:acetyltransferase-like isoleucine patch superfamily enzyme